MRLAVLSLVAMVGIASGQTTATTDAAEAQRQTRVRDCQVQCKLKLNGTPDQRMACYEKCKETK